MRDSPAHKKEAELKTPEKMHLKRRLYVAFLLASHKIIELSPEIMLKKWQLISKKEPQT